MWWSRRKQKLLWEVIKPPEWAENHPAYLRAIDQINWYDRNSVYNKKWYTLLKIIQISLAVFIPVITHVKMSLAVWFVSSAGAAIALLEGMQQLKQFSTLWVTYRTTTERLKHELFLFLSSAGPYKDLPNDIQIELLAERVEENVSTEHASWINETQKNVLKGNKNGK